MNLLKRLFGEKPRPEQPSPIPDWYICILARRIERGELLDVVWSETEVRRRYDEEMASGGPFQIRAKFGQ